MPYFHPRAAELPEVFPVFPLAGALLLPRGKLPLNIFEPRYLAMVEDALAAGRMFGMIQPDPSAPAGPNGPGLFHVGCLGRLSSFAETNDGRYMITLTGVSRFRLQGEVASGRGYRRVRGDFSPYIADLDLSPRPATVDRATLLAVLQAYFTRHNIDANWEAIRGLPEAALSLTLAMVCPFEPAEKQALLEAPDDGERDTTLLALLQMAAMEGEDGPGGRSVS
jgi:Lon protease-like protein